MQSALTRSQLLDVEGLIARSPQGAAGSFVNPYAAASPKHAPKPPAPGPRGAPRTRPLAPGWSTADVALYFAWWAFRPTACAACGQVGRWLPSADDDYKCAVCFTGSGSHRAVDVVEEKFDVEGDDRSDDDGDDDAAGLGTGDGSDTAVDAIGFFVRLLDAVAALAPAASSISVDHYPDIARVAFNLSYLLLLPDLDTDGIAVVRSAALFLSCTVLCPAILAFPLLQRVSGVDLEWHDIQAAARHLGIAVEDFFDEPTTHLRNFMVDLRHRPSSVLWDAKRRPQLHDRIAALAAKRQEAHSPDHTASFVLLELVRHDDGCLDEWAAALPQAVLERSRHPRLLPGAHGSVLLCLLAEHLSLPPVLLCDMLRRSGIYQGDTHYVTWMQTSVSCGNYPVPVYRRLSSYESPWAAVYRALHSEDRYVLLSLVSVLGASTERAQTHPSALKALQAVLHKHGAATRVLFNYCLRVADADEERMNGLYFCSHVARAGATYTCFTKAKSIRYKARSQTVFLNERSGAPEAKAQTTSLNVFLTRPVTAHIESLAAKLLLDAATTGMGGERWVEACLRIEAATVLRRRLGTFGTSAARLPLLLDLPGLFHTAREQAPSAPPLQGVLPPTASGAVAEFAALPASLLHPSSVVVSMPASDTVRRATALQFLSESGHSALCGAPPAKRLTPKSRPASPAVPPESPEALSEALCAEQLQLPVADAPPGKRPLSGKDDIRGLPASLGEPRWKKIRLEGARRTQQMLRNATETLRSKGK